MRMMGGWQEQQRAGAIQHGLHIWAVLAEGHATPHQLPAACCCQMGLHRV